MSLPIRRTISCALYFVAFALLAVWAASSDLQYQNNKFRAAFTCNPAGDNNHTECQASVDSFLYKKASDIEDLNYQIANQMMDREAKLHPQHQVDEHEASILATVAHSTALMIKIKQEQRQKLVREYNSMVEIARSKDYAVPASLEYAMFLCEACKTKTSAMLK